MSDLQRANLWFREGRYAEALVLFEQIQRQMPALAHIVQPNIELARLKLRDSSALPLSSSPLNSAQHDVVIFWKQNDSGLYGRRSDMIGQYLASRSDVRRVIFFDAPIGEQKLAALGRFSGRQTHHRLIHDWTRARQEHRLDRDKWISRVFIIPAHEEEGGSREQPIWLGRYWAFIDHCLAAEGIVAQQALFILYPHNPLAAALVDHFTPARVLVDVVDDQRSWPGLSAATLAVMERSLAALLRRAHQVWVNCLPMWEQIQPLFPAVRWVPNGTDRVLPVVPPLEDADYQALCRWPGPAIGYVGNLEHKLDLRLLSRIAERFPHCQLVFIGSAHANPAVLDLQRYPNVRLPGVIPYAELGAWLHHFKVAILPHHDNEMTRRMHPLKAFVYLSHGIPVVASAIHNLDEQTPLLKRAAHEADFLAAIEQALTAPRPTEEVVAAYHQQHHWSKRLEAPFAAIWGADGDSL